MFTLANWACVSSSLNQGQLTVTPFDGSPTVLNAPNVYIYASPNDDIAAISAANYFLPEYANLCVGDWILATGTDASNILIVLTSSSTGVTVGSFAASGTVGTANIINNAVTYAKIQETSAGSVLLGNPTGSAADVEEITLGNGLAFSGTAIQVPNTYLRFASVAMTLAQWQGMFATPFQVLAAPGAGLMHIIDSVAVDFTFGSAALTGGGATGLQYGNTIHLGGPAASATEAAADYLAAAANTMFRFGGGLGTGVATSSCINTAVFISNATGAYTLGTGGSFNLNVWYKTVSAT